jgi:hypothetical protein
MVKVATRADVPAVRWMLPVISPSSARKPFVFNRNY